MKIARVHFYVENATVWRDWFVRQLGFQAIATGECSTTRTEVVSSGGIVFQLSSPISPDSPVAAFLQKHPEGVADLAFYVEDIAAVLTKAVSYGAEILQPLQQKQQGESCLKWATISAWGCLSHTLIEAKGQGGRGAEGQVGFRECESICSPAHLLTCSPAHLLPYPVSFTSIDHVVLNVAAGDLERAIAWYENIFGFQPQQDFKIQTQRSGLRSRVMFHPSNYVKLPINEPVGANSQIQEFLDMNRGSGVQHIALRARNLVEAIARLRSAGVSFLPVPPSYYTQLQKRHRLPLTPAQWQQIADQQILVDWQDDGVSSNGETPPLLLQIFTQPIFSQPTFFFELIERRVGSVRGKLRLAQGFGEGNFRALFEAMEREQVKRGSLARLDSVTDSANG
jgi:4-hydroxyphenylpyruvate dioxygenase